jgi:hypothetical protein
MALHLLIEGVIGRAHVGELGIAAPGADDARREQRVLGGDRAERAVGVPQHIADIEQALPAIACQRPAVLAEIGDVVHAGDQALVLRLGDVAAACILDGAKVAGERHLFFVADPLAGKEQHRVAVHAGLDRGEAVAVKRRADVDAGDLGEEGVRLARPDREWHGGAPQALQSRVVLKRMACAGARRAQDANAMPRQRP